jgi:2-polyprenyl-3-methyl-5-hydroxy-6-metoxy-1,4-benzoquinol methylase
MEVRTVPKPLCPICSSQGGVLYRGLEDSLFSAPGIWSLSKCTNEKCGLCWLDPAPAQADLSLLYSDYATHGERASQREFKSRLRSAMLRIYESARALPLAIAGIKGEKLKLTNMFLDDLPAGSVLDLGCGDGRFLHRMYQAGWSVTGLDFDQKAIEAARKMFGKFGFRLLHTDLFSAQFPDNSFDAVTMNHVIEHVPEPIELLAEVRRVLKPEGRLVATTPNIRSLAHSVFADCWRGLEPPRHLQIFSLPALENCGRKAGFTKLEVKSSAANADVIVGGSFAIQQARKLGTLSSGNSEIHPLRVIRSSLMQYQEALLCQKKIDCGEELILVCHK